MPMFVNDLITGPSQVPEKPLTPLAEQPKPEDFAPLDPQRLVDLWNSPGVETQNVAIGLETYRRLVAAAIAAHQAIPFVAGFEHAIDNDNTNVAGELRVQMNAWLARMGAKS